MRILAVEGITNKRYVHNRNQKYTNKRKNTCSRTRKAQRQMSGSRSRKRSSSRNNSNSNSFSASLPRSKSICGRGGQQHRYKRPAIGKTCAVCKKPNHFAKLCFHNKKTGDRDVRLSHFQIILTLNKKILTKENLIMS